MNLEDLKKTVETFKQHPWWTTLGIVVVVTVVVLCWLGAGFLGEKGRQLASTPEQSPQELPSTTSHTNLVIRSRLVPPPAGSKYCLVVEFAATRERTDGANIALDVSVHYHDVDTWFGPPETYSPPPSYRGSMFTMEREKRQPPLYLRSYETPSITPRKSFYVKFKSNEPLKLKQASFDEYSP